MRAATRHAALVPTVLLAACTTVTRSVTAIGPPGEPAVKRASRSMTLCLDERLRAELRATDAVAAVAPSPAAPPLGLDFRFQTRVLGYSFDAGQVVLRDGQGGEWRPVEVTVGRLRYGECQAEPGLGEARRYVPVADGSCVLVRFDRAVAAGDRLELVIAGAALGRRRLEPVTVRLVRSESTWREADQGLVEVLTIPFKILLLPLAMYGGR